MVASQLVQTLKDARLRFIDSSVPGIKRKRAGSGFQYFDSDGKITGESILERINELKIPPAWKNVWICPSVTGYLQATGIDARGRKQYIYHPRWRQACQENKFSKLADFARSLPKIRGRVKGDLNRIGLDKEKILATVIWLLEHTFIRVGNEEYAKENDSFGLTTLRNKHAKVWGEKISFQFKGKSGVYHSISINHPGVSKVIKQCIELPGYEIFQYIDEAGFRHAIDSEQVNLYLKEVTGEDITAKEFRTWGGTTLAADTLNHLGFHQGKDSFEKNIRETVRIVSRSLGNTPKICRNYYIHPAVVETYKRNIFIPEYRKICGGKKKLDGLSKKEFAVLNLLDSYSFVS